MSTRNNTQDKPLAVPPREAWRLLSVGNTRGYELLKADELETYTEGRARRITMRSIEAYFERRLAAARPEGAGTPTASSQPAEGAGKDGAERYGLSIVAAEMAAARPYRRTGAAGPRRPTPTRNADRGNRRRRVRIRGL
jgi:hypothetical protein